MGPRKNQEDWMGMDIHDLTVQPLTYLLLDRINFAVSLHNQ